MTAAASSAAFIAASAAHATVRSFSSNAPSNVGIAHSGAAGAAGGAAASAASASAASSAASGAGASAAGGAGGGGGVGGVVASTPISAAPYAIEASSSLAPKAMLVGLEVLAGL